MMLSRIDCVYITKNYEYKISDRIYIILMLKGADLCVHCYKVDGLQILKIWLGECIG